MSTYGPRPRAERETTLLHGGAAAARAAAYHEAGHAVTAIATGCQVFLVSIVPDSSVWGGVRIGRCEYDARGSADDDELMIAVGGAVAESIATCRFVDVRGTDAARAWEVGRTAARIRAGRAWAERLLRDPARWRGVEALVAELLRSGEVSGREAFDLLRSRGAA